MPFIPAFYGVCQQADDGGAASPPGQVTGLTVGSTSTSELAVSWNAVSGATSYKVERSLSSGSGFSQILNSPATSIGNTGLNQGTRYYYRVRATNSNGDGAYSSVANNFTRPGQVTGLSATAASSSQINLSWNNPSGTETGFQVYRSTNSNMSGQTLLATPTGTTYSATGLSASTTYYFRVRAVNLGGTGAYSSIANATTQSGGVSAPSGVSIATSSSGNYNNAFIIDCTSGSGVIAVNSGSTFSSNTGDVELIYGPNYNSALLSNSGVLTFQSFGYIRATGATSFQWGLTNAQEIQDTNSAVSSVSSSGSASTNRDRTSTHMGVEVKVTHNSGGRGYLLMNTSGDGFGWTLTASATNSGGTTNATSQTVTVTVA